MHQRRGLSTWKRLNTYLKQTNKNKTQKEGCFNIFPSASKHLRSHALSAFSRHCSSARPFFMDDAFSSYASTSVSKETIRGHPEEASRHSAHPLAKGRQSSGKLRQSSWWDVLECSQNFILLGIWWSSMSEPRTGLLGLRGERWVPLLVILSLLLMTGMPFTVFRFSAVKI